MYLLFTTFTPVFEEGYHFSPGTAGLSYLGLGVGTLIGVIFNGYASDRLMARSSKGDGPVPERRLILMLCTAPFVPVGLFWYGWTAQAHAHWIVLIIGTVFLGFGMLSASVRLDSNLIPPPRDVRRTQFIFFLILPNSNW